MKSVFVIVTRPLGVCSHCDQYKATQHNKLLDLFHNHPDVTILHFEAINGPDGGRMLDRVENDEAIWAVNNTRLSSSDSRYYHPEMLKTYWRWFPSFFIFSAKNWMASDHPLDGEIYGGILRVNGLERKIEEIEDEYDARAEKIFAWFLSKTTQNGISTKPIIKTYDQQKTDIRMSMIKRQ